jgi:hypothetical protein
MCDGAEYTQAQEIWKEKGRLRNTTKCFRKQGMAESCIVVNTSEKYSKLEGRAA